MRCGLLSFPFLFGVCRQTTTKARGYSFRASDTGSKLKTGGTTAISGATGREKKHCSCLIRLILSGVSFLWPPMFSLTSGSCIYPSIPPTKQLLHALVPLFVSDYHGLRSFSLSLAMDSSACRPRLTYYLAKADKIANSI